MASMLPLGEKHQAFVNREEIHARVEEAVSIHLQGFSTECILQKIFGIPQAEQFQAVAA